MAMAMTAEQREEYLDWLEIVDVGGPFAPVEDLKKHIADAPRCALHSNEYYYIIGLIVGRQAKEFNYSESTIFDINQEAIASGDHMMQGVCDGFYILKGWI